MGFVPVPDAGFAVEPAQEHLAALATRREIEQTALHILHQDSLGLDGADGVFQAVIEGQKIAGHSSAAVRRVTLENLLHVW